VSSTSTIVWIDPATVQFFLRNASPVVSNWVADILPIDDEVEEGGDKGLLEFKDRNL
jgi:hypothetical protein